MTRYGTILLTVGFVLVIGEAKADDKADKDKLQGEWSLVKLEENGQNQDINEDNDHYVKLKIEGDKFMVTLKKGDHDATYTLDSSKKPKTLDVTLKGGDEDGKTIKAFYELEGDTLKICSGGLEAPERPAEFKSKDDVKIITFKRLKK